MMKIRNKEAERINSTCTPKELGEAMQSLDLQGMDPENRAIAIRERLIEVMMATTTDPQERRKENFQKAAFTYGQRRRAKRKSLII